MKLKNFLTVASVTAFIFGMGLILTPQMLANNFGVTLDQGGILFARSLGALLLGLGVINWLSRKETSIQALRPILWGNLVVQVLTGVIDFMGVQAGVLNSSAWVGIIIHILLGGGFAYFVFSKSSK